MNENLIYYKEKGKKYLIPVQKIVDEVKNRAEEIEAKQLKSKQIISFDICNFVIQLIKSSAIYARSNSTYITLFDKDSFLTTLINYAFKINYKNPEDIINILGPKIFSKSYDPYDLDFLQHPEKQAQHGVWKQGSNNQAICGFCGWTIPKQLPRLLLDNPAWVKIYLCPICIKLKTGKARNIIDSLPKDIKKRYEKGRKNNGGLRIIKQ